MGSPHTASRPKTADSAANSTVSSKVMTMYIGQLCSGRPAILRSECWVIRHGQSAHRQQAEDGRQRGEQYRQLEGDDDVHRPAMQRTPGDIDREIDHGYVILHKVAGQPSQNSPDQYRSEERRVGKEGR